ncbi:MAG: ADP-forming succinate--CoA ligase subunit beta [Candidatus Marinimicrobia bacterium]|jgi:succinyl-CoA synthetase beta subunit|nr:ADP-forming succinate--CoA ligase subunit beta [Candidatus Neomarinimicrobiota bacterium]MBT4270761.1 ADP-forming succinate--CoA ligase subunit beta [Candidatus Neomarinimicrobiota bacterium]MBT4809217.1 ADP-forming succinate--CoA ligase subunit beta [Candidatus Neomarinimicrobiota bacterium]MBT6841679.1 ADP-forming succinate--CoA ligase subunit beta [Candidatus Neomarinimicrobiota bacterium]MBT7194355.1 ADP-forming succinate--CoA ligase subunit beta [Candidatus Neomarinimicrobiota bacterium
MKIHEYQGKDIFKSYGIPIQDGYVIDNIDEAPATIKKVQQEFKTEAVVVKAQIHAGGRGKGGGVKYSPSTDVALENAQKMMGMKLITHQTGTEGQEVRKVYITQAFDIKQEYYCAITLDRSQTKDVFMVSSEGGVEIEKVAAETPEKIIKVWIDPLVGMKSFQARKLAFGLSLSGDAFKSAVKIFMKMYACYMGTDASIVEINPLVLTEDDQIVALDAKFNFDGNAMYRHKDIADLRDVHEEDPTELEASKYDLNYIKLDGNVGCMVNGAGLAMATMDIIKLAGGEPANFLDVGGAASAETVKNGFKIILSDDHVKAILINIFGGIVRCDRVANGVIQAVKELGLKVPVVVRLEGTNAKEAKTILSESGLAIIPANDMKDAAKKVVGAAINS